MNLVGRVGQGKNTENPESPHMENMGWLRRY